MTYRITPGYGDKYKFAEDPVTTLTNVTDLVPAPQIGQPKTIDLESIGKVKDGELKPIATVPVTFYDKNRTEPTESEASSPVAQATEAPLDDSPSSGVTKEEFMRRQRESFSRLPNKGGNALRTRTSPVNGKSFNPRFQSSGSRRSRSASRESFGRNASRTHSRQPLNSLETLGKYVLNAFGSKAEDETKVEKFSNKNYKVAGVSTIVVIILVIFCLSLLCIFGIIKSTSKSGNKTIIKGSKVKGGTHRLKPIYRDHPKGCKCPKCNQKHVTFQGLTPSEIMRGAQMCNSATLTGGNDIF